MSDLPPESPLPLLSVRNLTVEFSRGRHLPPLRAVDDVTLIVHDQETVGLVGESGSGKTTIGRAVLGLVPVTKGSVFFEHNEITNASAKDRRQLSGDLQVVFQDPYSSLNPTRTIGQTLGETLRVHERLSRRETTTRVASILERVGLPQSSASRHPADFSGGQRQRIAIARALIIGPRLVICDEPVSALDLSVQAQVLNLLRELQNEFHLSYLFISHDLAVVRHISRRVVVLYRGRIMEEGDAATVYHAPLHPYTHTLLNAAPVPDPDLQQLRRASALTVSASHRVRYDACPFVGRCRFAVDLCSDRRPDLEQTESGVKVACHRWRELTLTPATGPQRALAAVRSPDGDRDRDADASSPPPSPAVSQPTAEGRE